MKHTNIADKEIGTRPPEALQLRHVWYNYARLAADVPGIFHGNAIPVGPRHLVTCAHLGSDDDLKGREVHMVADGARVSASPIHIVEVLRTTVQMDIAMLVVDQPIPSYNRVLKHFPWEGAKKHALTLIGSGNTFAHVQDGFIVGSAPAKSWGFAWDWRIIPSDPLGPEAIGITLRNNICAATPDSGDSGGGIFAHNESTGRAELVGVIARGGPNRIGDSTIIGSTLAQAFDFWGIDLDTFYETAPQATLPTPTIAAPNVAMKPTTIAPEPQVSAADLEFLEALKRWVKAAK